MRRQAQSRGRRSSSESSGLDAHLQAYRSLLLGLDVEQFEAAIEELKGRSGRQVKASRRNDLAFVYLHFACLVRGEAKQEAEIEEIDRVFFLPLDPEDRIAFISHRRLDAAVHGVDGTAPAFEVRELDSEEMPWRTRPEGSAGRAGIGDALLLTPDEAAGRYPGLAAVTGLTDGGSRGKVLVVSQTAPNLPRVLIVLTPAVGPQAVAAFTDEDRQDLSAVARIFFQTFLSVRLGRFTTAYRELVDKHLALPAQEAGLRATRNRIVSPAPAPVRSFANQLCYLCDSLSRPDVLPEMDNALFFPLNSRVYYLYHAGAPTEAARPGVERPAARLHVGELGIESAGRRDELRRIRAHLADPALVAGLGGPERRCVAIFAAAIGLLCATAAPDSSAAEVGAALEGVQERIDDCLAALGQRDLTGDLPLVTAVEAALFPTVEWRRWELDLLDPGFRTYSGAGPAPGDESATFDRTGSLLALTVLVDHLPLGVLFLNSALAGAFGEEDRRDVQAIARGYFQTFQSRKLLEVIGEYQELGSTLSLSALDRAQRGQPKAPTAALDAGAPIPSGLKQRQQEARRVLGLYFHRLFEGFEDLEVGAFLAVDRDELSVYTRDTTAMSEGIHVALQQEAAELGADAAVNLKTRLVAELAAAPQAGASEMAARQRLRWFYRWALLRSLAPGDAALARYPLRCIPAQIFTADEGAGPDGGPRLRSILEPACFDVTLLDDDFPQLRWLLRRIGGSELLRSHTGSVIAMALFYDALPAGLILLCSSSFLAFTSRIEARDALMATRAFLLPVQMERREEVIRAYQSILGERSRETHLSYYILVLDFMKAMVEALPTMRAGLFLALDRDALISFTTTEEAESSHHWATRELADFGRQEAAERAALAERLDRLETARAGHAEGPPSELSPSAARRDDDLRLLYLRRLRDLFDGSRDPKRYGLTSLVEEIYRSSAAPPPPLDAPDCGPLRSTVHVLAEPSTNFLAAFPCLPSLFQLRAIDTERGRDIAKVYEEHWQAGGALLALLVLQEGLPLGIIFLSSPFEGSFTDHERIDVERSARSYFAAGQLDLRDEIIQTYRKIVSGLLSEQGTSAHIAMLETRSDRLRTLLTADPFAAHLAVFMDTLFRAFTTDQPETALFLSLSDSTIYVGRPEGTHDGSESGLNDLVKTNAAALALDLPDGASWDAFTNDWLRDVYQDIRATRALDLPQAPPAVADLLTAISRHTDTALASFLYSGHRFDQNMEVTHHHPYLAPFRRELSTAGTPPGEAGSLIVTALLYDYLPARGFLIICSSVPWRFTAQDRLDVEAVARAFFLTYRSIELRAAATDTAKLKGMQDMLLGVTHRLKNDLDPTLGVIDTLRKVVKKDPERIQAEVKELDRRGLIDAGVLGIEQVKNRFELLRSVIANSAHLHKPRRLGDLVTVFLKHVENYRYTLPRRQERYLTADIRVRKNELPSQVLAILGVPAVRVITALADTWIDVSDGLDEVLAIYAENAVKAVADPATRERTIHLWLLESDDVDRIEFLLYDRVPIPARKLAYIRRREVIPMEEGGGSGTGFYNAANLLALNKDGAQRVQSSDDLGGSAIWLTIARLRVDRVAVTPDQVALNAERWRTAVQALEGAGSISFRPPRNDAGHGAVSLYEGTYSWSEEIMPLVYQVFLQRYENQQLIESESRPYAVSTILFTPPGGGLQLEVSDPTTLGFSVSYATESDKQQRFAETHNGASRLGPKGAVGSCFLAMSERLSVHGLGIRISFGLNTQGFTCINCFFPAWADAPSLQRISSRDEVTLP